jgi:hypothetical protein
MTGSDKDRLEDPCTSRRKYVRADDNIPVYYELLIEEQDAPEGARDVQGGQGGQGIDWETMFEEIEPKPEENPRLYELLFDINQKLNILLNHMTENTGFKIPEARDVNISGGGLRFISATEFKAGDRLTLKTFLPTYAHVMRLKCEVLRVTPVSEGFETAVEFIDMDEPTREKIIRYIFSKQRRLLRCGKDQGR